MKLLPQSKFSYSTVDGEDFTVAPPGVFEATFVALSTSNGDRACDNITIIDDNALEGEHSFEIQIVSTDPLLNTISPASTVVTIQDNEGSVAVFIIFSLSMIIICLFSLAVETVSVEFEQTSYSASEDGSPSVEVCAQISNLQGDLECNLVVTFNAVSNNKSGVVVHIFIQQCEVITTK